MFRSLKFLYSLGIRHERVRIAAHLRVRASESRDMHDTALEMLSRNADLKKPSKSAEERLKFKVALEDRVQEIINDLFEEKDGHWQTGASLMFPDDEHKGEVK